MAFYLRRSFSESPDVFVFNDLKFQRKGENSQIDHLVLHPFGFYLIESKSVTGSIMVNQQGEYIRQFGTKTSGMKSPVTQVKMQAQLLKLLLTENRANLLGKAILGMVQKDFSPHRFRHLVAISDQGVIKRQGSAPPELVKADAVASEIEGFLQFQGRFTGGKSVGSFFSASNDDMDQRIPPWDEQELSSICKFLLENDSTSGGAVDSASKSVRRVAPPKTPEVQSSPEDTGTGQRACKLCNDGILEIRYGKYGYYFKCLSCEGNAAVDPHCPACNKKAKLRKSKKQFFWNCPCGFDALYYGNQ